MKVIEYNEKTFQQVLKDNKIVILKFSAEFCGPCRVLHKQMVKDKSDILIVEVDAEDEPELFDKHRIRYFPTMIFYKNGVKQNDIIQGANFDKIVEIYNKL